MKCPTCFELLISDSKNYIVTSPCGHLFHNDCVQAWLDRGNQSCPQCRTKLTREKLIRLYSFETTIEAQISHETNLNKQKSQSCSILYSKVADSINFQDQDLNLLEDPFEGHHRGNSSTPTPSVTLAPSNPLDYSNDSLELDEDYLRSVIEIRPVSHPTQQNVYESNSKTNCFGYDGYPCWLIACICFWSFWLILFLVMVVIKLTEPLEEVSYTSRQVTYSAYTI